MEVRGSEWGDGEVISGEDKGMAFTPDTEVKLVRYNAVRSVQAPPPPPPNLKVQSYT